VTIILGGDSPYSIKQKTPESIEDRRDAALRREGATKMMKIQFSPETLKKLQNGSWSIIQDSGQSKR
jgi:hypothetical protein